MKKTFWQSAFVLILSSSFLAGCDLLNNDAEEPGQNGVIDENGQVRVSEVRVDVSSGVTDAVELVNEAVVSVINLQRMEQQTPWGAFGGTQMPEEEEDLLQAGTGSGAIYKVDGETAFVFTNNHVIEGSDAIEVMFEDGSRVEADVIGADVWTDLAVLAIDAEKVTTVAEFGDSENLTVGEPAIAIGSPLGTNFASSVTSGIISAVERTVPVDTNMDGEMDWEMTAIQTDAAINPGNSGGPLINIAGQVVGINSMKISSSLIEGMGFAIPSNDAVDIINQLEERGEVIRPLLGVAMVDLSMVSPQQQRTILNLPEEVEGGVVVAEVSAGSAADEAGMEANDVIVAFDGQDVQNGIRLRQAIYNTDIGEEVEVEFYRDGERMSTTVTMRAMENMI